MTALPHGVYAIADGSAGRPVLDLVGAFVRGGAAVVQLRLKQLDSREFLRLAREARRICAGRALFIVNDRPDIAALAEADGVHLGQEDLPVAAAREVFAGMIGVSTHSDAEIDAAAGAGADYIGFGPVFATTSKPGAVLPPPRGVAGLQAAVRRSRVPVVAIGGITVGSARLLSGARCVASISELSRAADPAGAVRALREAFA